MGIFQTDFDAIAIFRHNKSVDASSTMDGSFPVGPTQTEIMQVEVH